MTLKIIKVGKTYKIMISQVIHELAEGWSVLTPLGSGTALLITTPSYLSNSILYVKMDDTSELKHFDSNDVRLYGSPTYDESLIPKTPNSWKKDTVNKIPPNAKRNMDFLTTANKTKVTLNEIVVRDFLKYLEGKNEVAASVGNMAREYLDGFLTLKEDKQ
jgi:hypothetical protein